MTALLDIHGISKSFNGFTAVKDCNLKLKAGVISGLIGPNGAGKSTLFNIVAGVHRPDRGRIRLDGVDVTGLPAHDMFAHGLLRTFQIPHEFSNLSAAENLLMVPAASKGKNFKMRCFVRQPITLKSRNSDKRP